MESTEKSASLGVMMGSSVPRSSSGSAKAYLNGVESCLQGSLCGLDVAT